MSDPTMSSVTPSQADSAAPSPATSSAPAAATEPSSFGTSRGSGLARGKRPTIVAPTAASTASRGDYKPTAVQVIVAEREYQNPFAPETPPSQELISPVPAFETRASVEVSTASAPADAASSRTPETVIMATPLAHPRGTEETPVAEVQENPESVPEKSSITILPPAEPRRPATSWDHTSSREESGRPENAERREDRPSFRPDRRGDRSRGEGFRNGGQGNSRDGRRDGREPRFQREDRPSRENRGNRGLGADRSAAPARTFTPQPPAPSNPEPAKKSGGFVSWIKGIFGGSSAESPSDRAPGKTPNDRETTRFEDRGGSRRRQGGGGRRFDQRGPREGQGGEFRGYGSSDHSGSGEGGGNRRRRHRGGRGRNRGEFGAPDSRSGGGREEGGSSSDNG